MVVMKRVPKKNISYQVSDIHAKESPSSIHEEEFSPSGELRERKDLPRASKRIFFIVTTLLFVTVAFVGIGYYVSRERALSLAIEEWRAIEEQLGDGTPTRSRQEQSLLLTNPAALFERVRFLFANAGSLYHAFKDASNHLVIFLAELEKLKIEWPTLLFSGTEGELEDRVGRMEESLVSLDAAGNEFVDLTKHFPEFASGAFDTHLAAQVELGRIRQFLSVLRGWLSEDLERSFVLLLNNPSELRPGGGFVGSYVDVGLRRGKMVRMDVHDINDVDREFEPNITPPKPLQRIIRRWRAADSNWFFDFSESAKKTLSFLEASRFYKNESTRFEGAIGVSPKVISDILELTGPIALAGSGREVNHQNFLFEIQREVQEGQASGESYPKQVLRELTPLLVERLLTLSGKAKEELSARALKWLAKKDLILYFREPAFQNFFEAYDVTGNVATLPQTFSGDYLAVVNANIGGGKTDLFIKQSTHFESQLDLDGTANNRVTIVRTHNGSESSSWWYRVLNQNFLQVFTPPGVQLMGVTGGLERRILPKAQYVKEGFAVDPDVEAIEKTEREYSNHPALAGYAQAGKNVFATWTEAALGETSRVVIEYRHKLYTSPSDEGTYQFIFDKQAGSRGEYTFEIHAPVGFRFRENGLPVFEYKTNDPPGRLHLSLTFEKAL